MIAQTISLSMFVTDVATTFSSWAHSLQGFTQQAPAVQQSVAAFALHVSWQAPLLAGAAWLAIRTGRPGPRLAHRLWSLTLLLCVVAPLWSTEAGWQAASRAQRLASRGTVDYGIANDDTALPALRREAAWKRMLRRHVGADGVHPFAFVLPPWAASLIAILYALTLLAFASRLVLAWVRGRALVRHSSPARLSAQASMKLSLRCASLSIRVPPVAVSDRLPGPALAGVWRPTLLLPDGMAEQMTAEELDAVLAHELAHLQRRDPALHAAACLLLVPIGFHPVALWIARRVHQTREMTCDADAAAQMGSRMQYAHALLRVAERTRCGPAQAAGPRLFTTGLGFFGVGLELFGAGGGAMEERMQMLMNNKRKRSTAMRTISAVGFGTAAVMACVMVQVQPALACARCAVPEVAVETGQTASAQAASVEDAQHLLGGSHAREQLRTARAQLDNAAVKASNDDDRRKLAMARDLAEVAEQQIAAAGGDDAGDDTVDQKLRALDRQNRDGRVAIHPNVNVRMDAQALRAGFEQARVQAEAMRQRFASPEWQASLAAQKEAAEKLREQLNSPRWKQQMEAAAKVRAQVATPEWQDRIAAQRAAAEQVRRQVETPEFKAQIERTVREAQEVARLDFPVNVTVPPIAVDTPGKPMKVEAKVLAANSVTKVPPVYPPDAKEKRVQGEVLLHVLVSEEGKVEQIQVVRSPDKQLSDAAVTAVQQWTYKPILLNGQPVPVDSTVSVHYSLVK